MKPLKALLALAVAMTTTSSFAETANPLATFKQEAKTAINNELSSAKKTVTQTESSAATDMSKMKNAAELSKISGIGDATIEKISPYLTF